MISIKRFDESRRREDIKTAMFQIRMSSFRSMPNIVALLFLAVDVALFSGPALSPALGADTKPAPEERGFAGSRSCRECHERFYQLWSTSYHGLAMQPYSEALAKEKLTPQKEDLAIGAFRYRAEIGEGQGWLLETGPDGTKKYPMEHVLGGKNVFYFLTPLEKGRLQTLPVAGSKTLREKLGGGGGSSCRPG